MLPNIISKDQNGYLKGRFIGYNIRSILDVIAQSKHDQLDTIVAFLDFEKAFDKLNWTFMDKSLKAFGFGPNFRKWISIMYNDISSCVINNGYTSQYFKLKCGIRQGCPLSALIFIMCAETLTSAIKKNDNIKGVFINGVEIKSTQLADDTTLFLKDIRSLHLTLNTLFMFNKSSGLVLNYSKTKILNIGHKYSSKGNPFDLKWVKEKVYALGTWFYEDLNMSYQVNHEARLQMIKSVITAWKPRKLTWYGKVTVIKSLVLSKMNYCTMSLPTPLWFVNAVQSEINSFLWDGKPARVKFLCIIGDYEHGGLKHPCVDSIVMAQKAMWIKRLMDVEMPSSLYIRQFLPAMKFMDILNCNIHPDDLPHSIPQFYRQVLHSWYKLRSSMKYNSNDDEIIWLNRVVKSPTTLSELPYIGEVSTTLPPSLFISLRTCIKGSLSCLLFSTSNVCQVPNPTTGIFSFEEGINRFTISSLGLKDNK